MSKSCQHSFGWRFKYWGFFSQVSQPYLGWLVELTSSFLQCLRRTVTSIVPRDRRPKQPRRPMEQGAIRDLGRAIKGLQGLEILPCLGVLNSGVKRMILYFNSNSCTCVKYIFIYIYMYTLYNFPPIASISPAVKWILTRMITIYCDFQVVTRKYK